MGIDLKYGRVTVERPGPDEDEPVVVFRAQDSLLPDLMRFYYTQCQIKGSPRHHLELIKQSLDDITEWQSDNSDRVRIPRSDRYADSERRSEDA